MLRFLLALRDPDFYPGAVRVAVSVGSLLFIINHGPALIRQEMTPTRWISALLTYIVPYVVNIHGRYSYRLHIENSRENGVPKDLS